MNYENENNKVNTKKKLFRMDLLAWIFLPKNDKVFPCHRYRYHRYFCEQKKFWRKIVNWAGIFLNQILKNHTWHEWKIYIKTKYNYVIIIRWLFCTCQNVQYKNFKWTFVMALRIFLQNDETQKYTSLINVGNRFFKNFY